MSTKQNNSGKSISIEGNKSIAEAGFKALIWNYSGTSIGMSMQLLTGILLARLLGPDSYGLYAIGMLIIGIGSLVTDLGLSVAIVQRPIVTPSELGEIFFLNVFVGLVFSLTCYFFADDLSSLFRSSAARPLIEVMSLVFFIQAFGMAPGAIMRRSLDFRSYQLISITSYVLGYTVIGVSLALMGFKEWSLVGALLSQMVIFSVLVVWRTWGEIRLVLHFPRQSLIRNGGIISFTNVVNWGISNVDAIALGRMQSTSELGLYTRAIGLLAAPINSITNSFQGVLLATFSRVNNNDAAIRAGYLGASHILALACLPLCAFAASVPKTLILATYGEKWLSAVPLLPPIALAIAFNSLFALCGPVLVARGKAKYEMFAQIFVLSVAGPTIYIAATNGTVAVAWTVACISILRWTVMLVTLCIETKLKYQLVIKMMRWPIIVASIVFLSAQICDHTFQTTIPIVSLIANFLVAITVAISILIVFNKMIFDGSARPYVVRFSKAISDRLRNYRR